jgi:CDP-diacylglycerol--serine O-phosphatidyltransferase
MNILRHLPNFLTSLNLLLGTVGAYLAIVGRPDLTVICVLIAAVFDFFDGFAARMLKAYSAIGKDLDSLADLISFGLAPAAAYSSMLHYFITGSWTGEFWNLPVGDQLMLLFPFILTVFSALRLAKFNNDTRQTENFLGLTTTATGMFSVSFAYMCYSCESFPVFFRNPLFIFILIIVFSALLVSEIPMFSLKFKHFRWKGNEPRYILLVVSLISLICTGWGALTVIIPVYVIYSIALYLINGEKG